MHPDEDWPAYFAAGAGRRAHPDLIAAAERCGAPGRAVDLGAGDGTESRWLLARGWRVHAVDGTPGLRERILAGLADPGPRLCAVDALFGQLHGLPRARLVYAGFALPFASPAELTALLGFVRAALEPGGVFAAHFLAERDDWRRRPGVQVQDEGRLRRLLRGLQIESIQEREYDAGSGTGPKHWHLRFVLARRPPASGGPAVSGSSGAGGALRSRSPS